MTTEPMRERAYKHLETDVEFKARLREERIYFEPHWGGDHLDERVWTYHKKQRRLVWVTK